jgi:hypothetical protein
MAAAAANLQAEAADGRRVQHLGVIGTGRGLYSSTSQLNLNCFFY